MVLFFASNETISVRFRYDALRKNMTNVQIIKQYFRFVAHHCKKDHVVLLQQELYDELVKSYFGSIDNNKNGTVYGVQFYVHKKKDLDMVRMTHLIYVSECTVLDEDYVNQIGVLV